MAANKYKIRCSVVGHEKDVRSVVPAMYPDGGFISGSRDVTARVWAPNEHDLGFTEAHIMSGHNKFVSCVCTMPPDEMHPHGVILTGSNDNTILAFTLESPSPIYKLEGHTNTVCSLAAGKFGTLISGSWDETAKVWLNQKCLMTLKGHSAAVWSVAILPEGGFMLTGSADKTIKMWKAGKCERTFTGHDDCVRGLVVLSTAEFLSCSNDASVRHWLTSGDCIHTYYGHTNYVYSIALLPNGTDFVTTGEDRTLRVWRNGECEQTLAHPTQSVWSVCVLSNGDIVTGSSDGVARVFSSDSSRQGSDTEQKSFEEQLAGSSIPTQIGDIPTDQLPGLEALVNPGKRDGQHLMVKDGSDVIMHQWNASESRWVKIGSVVGGSGGSQGASGKQLYQGKEYDYVFDVELQEGSPPLKLPYNISEDPYMAAHTFLENNEVSHMFLDQVAEFIVQQTKDVTIGPRPSPSLSDPFTGAGRYIPGSSGDNAGQGGSGTDPFTGGNRYIPGSSSQAPLTQQPTQPQYGADPFTGSGSYRPTPGAVASNQYFPKTSYYMFDSANTTAILGKLKEFNSQADQTNKVPDHQVNSFEGLMTGVQPVSDQLQQLGKLLQWPAGVLFPVLDTLRLAIRTPTVNQHFCSDQNGPMFLTYLLTSINPAAPPANQRLALRTLCNIFKHDPGRSLLLSRRDNVLSAMLANKDSSDKTVHIGSSSLLLNYAVAYAQKADSGALSHCLSTVLMLSEIQKDPEAVFRLLICLGTLISADKTTEELAKSLGITQFTGRCKSIKEPSKVAECAKLLEDSLK